MLSRNCSHETKNVMHRSVSTEVRSDQDGEGGGQRIVPVAQLDHEPVQAHDLFAGQASTRSKVEIDQNCLSVPAQFLRGRS
jgi:hypothetical protein